MKKLLLLGLTLSMSYSVFGQQDPIISQYMFDKSSINPAVTGLNKGYCASLFYRNQHDKTSGAPNTVLFNAQASVPNINMGFGINFVHDAIGFQKQNSLNLNAAYHYRIGTAGVLSAGLGIGFNMLGFNPDWITPDGTFDPNLPASANGMNFRMNFGLHWRGTAGSNQYYIGISGTNLIGAEYKSGGNSLVVNDKQHLYIFGGYDIKLRNIPLKIKPSVLVRTDLTDVSFDLNVMVDYRLNSQFGIHGGLTYRLIDAVALMAGVNVLFGTSGSMTIGYSYDITTSKPSHNNFSAGSHEFFLKGCFFQPAKPIERSNNPRWLY